MAGSELTGRSIETLAHSVAGAFVFDAAGGH